MTAEERKLWYEFLKPAPFHISRQKVLGCYIVDFYCASAKTVIELDGSQHYEPENKAKDETRDAYFLERGIKVLRYTNLQIHQEFDSVCNDIYYHLKGEI